MRKFSADLLNCLCSHLAGRTRIGSMLDLCPPAMQLDTFRCVSSVDRLCVEELGKDYVPHAA